MKFKNLKLNLLLTLCLISMISIGFSSWKIGDVINSPDGIILIDDVKSYTDFIKTKNDIEIFKYYNNGFIHDSYFIGDEAHVIANFEINLTNCRKKFVDKSSIDLELTLKYSKNFNTAFNIFLDTQEDEQEQGYHTLSSTVTSNDTNFNVGESYGQTNKKYIVPITFNNVLKGDLSSIEFSIDYCFYATHGDYFKNNIFNNIKNIDFEIGISIEGK